MVDSTKTSNMFCPWVPGQKRGTASRDETAVKLYNRWTQRYESNKKLWDDLTLDDVGDEEDLHDLFLDYAILLTVHPVFEGWHKPNIGSWEDQACPKRLSVDTVTQLFAALLDVLKTKFPEHPPLQNCSQTWWKQQTTTLRKNLEKESKKTSCC